MVATSSRKNTAASVSRPVVSGVPSQLDYLFEIILNPGSFVANAVNKALTEEVGELRTVLKWSHVEYTTITNKFDIEWDDKAQAFTYVVEGALGNRAREIEYGTPSEPAARVQTTAAVHRSSYLERRIQKYLDEELGIA
jgi:hypothetical protein